MWPFTQKKTEISIMKAVKPEALPCFMVGPYALDAPPPSSIVLRPFSDLELNALGRDVTFVGELVAWAPNVQFEDIEWQVVLGLVNGVIYKISLQFTGARATVGHFNRYFMIRCNRDFVVGSNMGGAQIWDAKNGNICTDGQNFGDKAVVTVTLTSNEVRNFRRES